MHKLVHHVHHIKLTSVIQNHHHMRWDGNNLEHVSCCIGYEKPICVLYLIVFFGYQELAVLVVNVIGTAFAFYFSFIGYLYFHWKWIIPSCMLGRKKNKCMNIIIIIIIIMRLYYFCSSNN